MAVFSSQELFFTGAAEGRGHHFPAGPDRPADGERVRGREREVRGRSGFAERAVDEHIVTVPHGIRRAAPDHVLLRRTAIGGTGRPIKNRVVSGAR